MEKWRTKNVQYKIKLVNRFKRDAAFHKSSLWNDESAEGIRNWITFSCVELVMRRPPAMFFDIFLFHRIFIHSIIIITIKLWNFPKWNFFSVLLAFFRFIYFNVLCNHLSLYQYIGFPRSPWNFYQIAKKGNLFDSACIQGNPPIIPNDRISTPHVFAKVRNVMKMIIIFMKEHINGVGFRVFLYYLSSKIPQKIGRSVSGLRLSILLRNFRKLLFNNCISTKKTHFHFKYWMRTHIQIANRKTFLSHIYFVWSCFGWKAISNDIFHFSLLHRKPKENLMWHALKMIFIFSSVAFGRIINSNFPLKLWEANIFFRVMLFHLSKSIMYYSMSLESHQLRNG